MKNNQEKLLYLFLLIPFAFFGAVSGISNGQVLQNFLWGLLIGIPAVGLIIVGAYVWEWMKNEMLEGKLRPYILSGLVASLVICGILAFTLGNPSCIDYDSDARTCNEYADDGFIPTVNQRWNTFLSSFPVTTIITVLISVIVHSNIHKKQK